MVLPRSWGISILSVVGSLAFIGIVLKLTGWAKAQWFAYALYPVMGWVMVVSTPLLIDNLSALQMGLLIGGGLAYTIGFPVLLVRRPNPWPMTFGYHEVWHVFTIVAAVLHFAVVASVLA
jgi:hemolysin III